MKVLSVNNHNQKKWFKAKPSFIMDFPQSQNLNLSWIDTVYKNFIQSQSYNLKHVYISTKNYLNVI